LGLNSVLFFELVFAEHFIEDAVEVVAVFRGQGKYIPELFNAAEVYAG
jgi:hypothetical protein